MKKSLVIIEDDPRFRDSLALEFRERGYDVFSGDSFESLVEKLPEKITFAVIDLRIGEKSGLNEIKKILAHSSKCRALILTGFASLATAVEAIKLGAINYLSKPASISQIETALWIDSESGQAPSLENSDRGESLARHEREYIEFVIQQCNGNISEAARWLGIHRQSLQRKLRKFSPR